MWAAGRSLVDFFATLGTLRVLLEALPSPASLTALVVRPLYPDIPLLTIAEAAILY
jgi:hypothetical protein